jgi:hypothetical protein
VSPEEALEFVQALVFAQNSKYLDNIQTAVLRGAWENQTYEQIAETYCFSSAHAKAVGANLWHFLSKVFGTKVNKKNFHAVLQRRVGQWEQKNREVEEQGKADSELSWSGFGTEVIDEEEKLSAQPIPTNSEPIELPGGQVPLDSYFYVERPPIEQRSYNAILQPGALIRIHAPRQMGKTSLMARILHQAREQDYRTVTLSFQLAGREIFTNLDRFLQWFCASIGRSLGLPNQLADYWDDILGSNYSSTDYFEKSLLAQIDSPVVVGLDDLEVLFQYPEITWDFFSLLRAWYEKAKHGNSSSDVWKKLRLVVVHSTDVYIPLNINHSPFNVGLSIELPEFTSEQVQDLAQRHGLDWDAPQVEQLMSLVGGYPYLVRKGLYHICHQDVTLEQLLPKSATKGRVYGEHLRRQLSNLQQYPELCTAFSQVANSLTPVELDRVQALKLQSMGLVHLRGNQVMPSCDLYRQYFSASSC